MEKGAKRTLFRAQRKKQGEFVKFSVFLLDSCQAGAIVVREKLSETKLTNSRRFTKLC